MASILNPYLNFRGQAREAMEFYRSALGGELNLNTFSAFGMPVENAAEAEWVMHGQLTTPAGFTLMGSDVPTGMPFSAGSNGSVSLSGDNDGELTGYWNALVVGGTITAPLEVAPWGDKFGMLTDRFGVNWLVNIALPRA